MRDEALELGCLSRFGKFYEVPVTDEQIADVNSHRPPRVINEKIQDWRCQRRPDNPFTSDPRQTVCLQPALWQDAYEFQRRNS